MKDAFQTVDTIGKGYISTTAWADVMQHTLRIHIRWVALMPVIVPLECLHIDSASSQVESFILYEKFLEMLDAKLAGRPRSTSLSGSETASVTDYSLSSTGEIIVKTDIEHELEANLMQVCAPTILILWIHCDYNIGWGWLFVDGCH